MACIVHDHDVICVDQQLPTLKGCLLLRLLPYEVVEGKIVHGCFHYECCNKL